MGFFDKIQDNLDEMNINTIFTKNNRLKRHDTSGFKNQPLYVDMVLPLYIGIRDNAEWKFPIEPLVSISGKNVVVKRNVSKPQNRGTVKERWSEDDFQITIEGSFRGINDSTYPSEDVHQLLYYLNQKTALYVKNDLFDKLGIRQIVIESYSFPFSKGENVQNFTIEAVSDDKYELFIDTKIEPQYA